MKQDNFCNLKFIVKNLLMIVTMFTVVACSSSPEQSSPKSKRQNTQTNERFSAVQTTPSHSAQASQRSLISSNIRQALEVYESSGNKAEISALLQNVDPQDFFSIEQDLSLAKLYLYLQLTDNADIIIYRLKQGALPTKHQIPLWLISAQLDAQKGEHLNSVRTLFRLSQLYGQHLSFSDKALSNQLIWQNLLLLSPSSLTPFQSDFGEEVDSWIQLAQLIEGFSAAPARFSKQIENWAIRHGQYSQSNTIPAQVLQLSRVETFKPQNIAIVLPFTNDKLKKQSLAIRDGLLAGLNFNQSVRVSLLDSHKLTLSEIEQQITELQIDFIIGPLLKTKIEEFNQSEVLANIAQLNLNTIDTEKRKANKFYFALSPEDEIEQAVDYFVSRKIEHPAVIYADNSLGRRLSSQFSELWQESTNKQLENIAFQSQSKLGEAVKELLDVGLSAKRIKQINRLLGAKIKSEERSRTDIDAIYVIANSQQTRLIKPFFDVNVSNFAEKLPIYASSRSYVVGETSSEKTDLNGLTFTEMPWLVSNSNPELNQLYQQVGDNNTQLKKLFAFGYDSIQLLPILNHLALLPEISIKSLTGTLRIDELQRIKRNLEWAQYKQGKVSIVNTIR